MGLMNKLGLHRKELRAWAMYDWANSAFATTVMVAVLPIFYASYAGDGLEPSQKTAFWGYTSSIAMFLIAMASPVFGVMADLLGNKKKFLAFFAFLGAGATALLGLIWQGGWMYASAVYILAKYSS